jgi:hypothetical protein
VWSTDDWTLVGSGESDLGLGKNQATSRKPGQSLIAVYARMSWAPDGSAVGCARGFEKTDKNSKKKGNGR